MGNIVAPRDEMVAVGAPIGQTDNDCNTSSPVFTDKMFRLKNGRNHTKIHTTKWRPPYTAWKVRTMASSTHRVGNMGIRMGGILIS